MMQEPIEKSRCCSRIKMWETEQLALWAYISPHIDARASGFTNESHWEVLSKHADVHHLKEPHLLQEDTK